MRKYAIAALTAALMSSAAYAAPGLTSVSGAVVWPNGDNQDHSLGWAFSTTGQTVAALGYNDFGFSSAHLVGLYDSGGTLLASATVTGASTLVDGYRYTNLGGTLALGAGTYYLVGTTMGLNDGWIYQAGAFTTNAATTYLGSYYTSGTGGALAFPGNSAGGRQYLLVNFQSDAVGGAVPEPASWAMMIGGLAIAGSAMRRRAAKVAFA